MGRHSGINRELTLPTHLSLFVVFVEPWKR
jgi:hypothetical protein